MSYRRPHRTHRPHRFPTAFIPTTTEFAAAEPDPAPAPPSVLLELRNPRHIISSITLQYPSKSVICDHRDSGRAVTLHVFPPRV